MLAETSPPTPPRAAFIRPLHGLRGLMAVWVLCFHLSTRIAFGFLAVDVFFVLSGFVLMRTHGAEFLIGGTGLRRRFFLLRWWRTYPTYAVGILLSLAVYVILKSHLPPARDVLESVMMVAPWMAPGIGFNDPAWSLEVEWLGYAAFPAFAWIAMRLSPASALAAAIAILLLEVLLMSSHDGSISDGNKQVLRMAAGFAAGCLLFRVAPDAGKRGSLWRDAAMLAAIAATVAVLRIGRWPLALPVLFGIVWLTAAAGPVTSWILSNRLAMFLGRISFALYLCHFPIRALAEAWQPPDLVGRLCATLLVIAVSTGLAWLVCRYVEEPLRRFGRRPPPFRMQQHV